MPHMPAKSRTSHQAEGNTQQEMYTFILKRVPSTTSCLDKARSCKSFGGTGRSVSSSMSSTHNTASTSRCQSRRRHIPSTEVGAPPCRASINESPW